MTFHVISDCAQRRQPRSNGYFGGSSTSITRSAARALHPKSVEGNILVNTEEGFYLVVIRYGIVPAAEGVALSHCIEELGIDALHIALYVLGGVLTAPEFVGNLYPIGMNHATGITLSANVNVHACSRLNYLSYEHLVTYRAVLTGGKTVVDTSGLYCLIHVLCVSLSGDDVLS